MSTEFKDHEIPGLKDKDNLDQTVFFINESKLSNCLELEIDIKNGITVKAILDSGSEVNLMSGRVFEQLNKGKNDISVLPLENVVLVTASGRRTKKIRKQALIEFKIGENEFEGVFMISPQLVNDAIIGC
jgi:hypothetical protein